MGAEHFAWHIGALCILVVIVGVAAVVARLDASIVQHHATSCATLFLRLLLCYARGSSKAVCVPDLRGGI